MVKGGHTYYSGLAFSAPNSISAPPPRGSATAADPVNTLPQKHSDATSAFKSAVQGSGNDLHRRFQLALGDRLIQFIKFCLVGGSGVVVDMTVLYLLADPRCLDFNLTLSKIAAAEAALTNNFLWNELWTFRRAAKARPGHANVLRRFLFFNAICGIGIGLAVVLLHTFHTWVGLNVYLSNLLAIVVVTLWNFGLNASLNWRSSQPPIC